MKTRKFARKKRGKSRKKYFRIAGVLNRPSNMVSLRVEKKMTNPPWEEPGVRTFKRQNRSKKELMLTLEKLIHKIEKEKDEYKRKELEQQLVSIAQLIAEY